MFVAYFLLIDFCWCLKLLGLTLVDFAGNSLLVFAFGFCSAFCCCFVNFFSNPIKVALVRSGASQSLLDLDGVLRVMKETGSAMDKRCWVVPNQALLLLVFYRLVTGWSMEFWRLFSISMGLVFFCFFKKHKPFWGKTSLSQLMVFGFFASNQLGYRETALGGLAADYERSLQETPELQEVVTWVCFNKVIFCFLVLLFGTFRFFCLCFFIFSDFFDFLATPFVVFFQFLVFFCWFLDFLALLKYLLGPFVFLFCIFSDFLGDLLIFGRS